MQMKLRGASALLMQARETLRNSQTLEREVNALTEAMSELGLKSALIVTRNA